LQTKDIENLLIPLSHSKNKPKSPTTSARYVTQTSQTATTAADEFITLISQLNHIDKLRLAQWLINSIAREEGINEPIINKANQTGLYGIWQDSRPAEVVAQEIIGSRTESREFSL